MYPMGNIPVKPDFRLSMSSNPRPHQKQGGQKLSELVEQCLLGRQSNCNDAPSGAFFVSTHPWTNLVRSDANVKLPVTNEAQMP
jgi:hypothetical protein